MREMNQHNRMMFRGDEHKVVQRPKSRTNILIWYVGTREMGSD